MELKPDMIILLRMAIAEEIGGGVWNELGELRPRKNGALQAKTHEPADQPSSPGGPGWTQGRRIGGPGGGRATGENEGISVVGTMVQWSGEGHWVGLESNREGPHGIGQDGC